MPTAPPSDPAPDDAQNLSHVAIPEEASAFRYGRPYAARLAESPSSRYGWEADVGCVRRRLVMTALSLSRHWNAKTHRLLNLRKELGDAADSSTLC